MCLHTLYKYARTHAQKTYTKEGGTRTSESEGEKEKKRKREREKERKSEREKESTKRRYKAGKQGKTEGV
jgi:hypothetical protein